jgi:hypothetical protein
MALLLSVAVLPLLVYLVATVPHHLTTTAAAQLSASRTSSHRRCHHHNCARPQPSTPATPTPAPTVSATPTPPPAPAPTPTTSSAPPSSALAVCGNSGLLTGPSSAPSGAITVAAGDNSSFGDNGLKANTTYWFAPGTHTLGTSEFGQIQPAQGDTFIGAPGAVLTGQGRNDSAFDGNATGVTIEYLTIEDFTPPGSQGAVNHDSGQGWVVSHNTIQDNAPGAGVMIGSQNTVTNNCLTKNGEYGFSAYVDPSSSAASPLTHGPADITVSDNEISYNDTCNFEDVSPNPVPAAMGSAKCGGGGEGDGCGCAGAGKFWQVQNATVDGNYVHDNYDTGLWADTNNDGFTFKNNYIARNYGPGIMYEISYNALIEDNTFVSNAVGEGPTNGGFPTGAIYVSESGGDSRVPNAAGITTLSISGNVFTNNWSGVVLWESADRFCGSPDNSSTGTCTLTDPSVANVRTCAQSGLQAAAASKAPDLYDLCRWKTQNVAVSGNTFNMDDSAVSGCKGSSNSCGENAIFSQYGTDPGWSPYKGFAVSDAMTSSRNDKFSGNTYTGGWSFMYHDQSTILTPAQWQAKGQD